MRSGLAGVAMVLLATLPVIAHRLDEYLQGTILSIERDRVSGEMTLTPGVIVFPFLFRELDSNNDGVISPGEQSSYTERVLKDLYLEIDGHRLTPRLVSSHFPEIAEMKEGRGAIRIQFETDFPPGGPNRKLTLENGHDRRISVYQVNCLVPGDPGIRIVQQKRNYTQSLYEVEFAQSGGPPAGASLARFAGIAKLLVLLTLLLGIVWRVRWLARGAAWWMYRPEPPA